jgi:hypothetical protein
MGQNPLASENEIKELTDQFFVTLRAYVARLSAEDERRSPKSFAQIEDLLKDDRPKQWSDAYQIEQLIVDLFDDRTLEVELQSRLLEAESNLSPSLAAQYAKLIGGLKTPGERRAVLARMVNDLQWRHTVNEVKRSYAKLITNTTGVVFVASIAAFALTIAAFAFMGGSGTRYFAKWSEPTLLLLAAVAGGWGAGFSMLAGLKSRLDAAELNDLKLMKSRGTLWSRPLIGVGAAAILYFFIASGLLGGAAFPDLRSWRQQTATVMTGASQAATAPPADPTMQLALLIVWCFVAGFSERLVPALLAKTEERGSAAALGSERFKPGPADAPSGKLSPQTDQHDAPRLEPASGTTT